MTRTSRPTVGRLSRRSVLGAAVGSSAWLLTGCEAGTLGGERRRSAAVDPDGPLLEEVRTAATTAGVYASAVIATHPGLSQRLTPLREMHDAHLAVLGAKEATSDESGSPTSDPPSPTGSPSSGAATPAPPEVPRRPGRALAAVRVVEEQYAATLAAAVPRVASGPLARTLATAQAGVVMHVAALQQQP